MKPIAFYPQLARELGDIQSAIFYQQIHFWSDKGSRDDGFIYKTQKEIEFETTLTRDQQDRIRKKLVKTGWLEVKKIHANGKPVLHYKPLRDITLQISNCGKPTNGNVGNPQLQLRETRKCSISENTTEKTTKDAPATPDAPFVFENYLKTMDNDKREAIQLIAYFFRKRKLKFTTREQVQIAVRRHLRAANQIVKFPKNTVFDAFKKVERMHRDIDWSLETVLKKLTN